MYICLHYKMYDVCVGGCLCVGVFERIHTYLHIRTYVDTCQNTHTYMHTIISQQNICIKHFGMFGFPALINKS
jgi:hypothetical protein